MATPLEAIAAGLAPRMEAGWRAMLAVLGDGDWHPHAELEEAAADSSGELAPGTCRNILADARSRGLVIGGQRSHHRKNLSKFWYRLPE